MNDDNKVINVRKNSLNRSHTPELFQQGIVVTHGYFDVEEYLKVLSGESIAYHAQNIIPQNDCDKIAKQYRQYEPKFRYSVKPIIDAIGKPLYHGKKEESENYFSHSAELQKDINRVFELADVMNYNVMLFEKIKEYLFEKYNILTRKIQNRGKEGLFGIIRSWGDEDVDALGRAARLHEDRLQLRHHELLETQTLFESTLASTCIYYANSLNGKDGTLKVYDIRPGLEDADKEAFGTEYNYGFNDALINNLPFVIIKPQAGDVVTFLADRLHEVYGVKTGSRINSTFFSALTPDNKTNLLWS